MPTDAVSWNEQMSLTAGGGAFPGVGGGGPMHALGDILQALLRILPAFGGSTGPTAQAARIMAPFAIANAIASPDTPLLGAGTSQLLGRAQLQMALSGGMTGMRGAGGGLPGGFGIGPGMAGMLGAEMEALRTPGAGGTTLDDLTGIAVGGAGFMGRGVGNARQARERVRELTSTVLELQRELSMTVDETMQKLSAVRQMGFTSPGAAAGAVRSIMQTSAVTGLPMEQTVGIMADQGAEWRSRLQQSGMGISMRHATGMVQTGLNTVGGAVRSGILSDDMLLDATGATGAQGTSLLLGRVQEMGNRFLRDPRANYMIAAAMDPKTMQLNQQVVNQMMTGSMGAGEIQRLAEQNVGGLGPDALGQWRGMQSQLRGQFQEMTGGMGGLAIARSMMDRYGINLDPSDPGSVARFQAVTKTRDPLEARTMMTLIQNYDVIQEEGREVQRVESQRQERISEHNRRMQSSSIEAFGESLVRKHQEAVSRPFVAAAEDLSARIMQWTGTAPEAYYDASAAAASGAAGFHEAARTAQRAGARGGFFDPAEAARRRREVMAEAVGVTDPTMRRTAILQAVSAQGASDAAAGGQFDATSGYWRGRRPGSRESEMASVSGLMGMTADEVTSAGAAFRETSDTRNSFLRSVTTKLSGPHREAFLTSMRGILPDSYAADIANGFENQTLFDIAAGLGPEQRAKVIEQVYSGMPSHLRGVMIAEATKSLDAMSSFAGHGVSIGSLETALGMRSSDGRSAEEHMRASQEALTGAGVRVGKQAALIAALQTSPDVLARLVTSTEGQTGTKKLGELLGELPEDQKARFSELLGEEITLGADFTRGLQHAAAASVERQREAVLASGWLSEDAAKKYRDIASDPRRRTTDPTSQFATSMLAARSTVEGGSVQAGLSAAGGAISALVELDEQGWTRAKRDLGDTVTMSEVEKIRNMRGRRSRGGRTITAEEITSGGFDLKELRQMTELAEEDFSADRIGMEHVQKKIQAALGEIAARPGGTAGAAGGATAEMNPMTEAVAEGFRRAMGGKPLEVVIMNTEGLLAARGGSDDERPIDSDGK